MGDHTAETCDRLLGGYDLHLRKDVVHWISGSDHVGCFVGQSRGNQRIRRVFLYINALYGQDDVFWGKVGQAIGNLRALYWLRISTHHSHDDDDEVVPIPDLMILARILSYVQQRVTVITHEVHGSAWHVEDIRSLARAIRGHPTITRFDSNSMPLYEASDVMYSALATLPALESVDLSAPPENEITLANPERLTELLRIPSLRDVRFYRFYFTSALCHATANALTEGSAVTELRFSKCSFSAAEGCAAIMANALARNTSVSSIKVDETLYSVLATALPSNSTLRCLELERENSDRGPDLSPFFMALGKNTGLKTLTVRDFGWMDKSLCTAMQNGLGMNETLESLELYQATLLDADLWHRALSFLRTNKVLKSLIVNVFGDATELCGSAFCRHIAAMLQENVSLESLSIRSIIWHMFPMQAEKYFVLFSAIQHNTKLKSLYVDGNVTLTHDEDKQMALLLKNNYVLESLPYHNQGKDVGAILRLNEAGRRYLLQDGSSIPKGVEVLSKVNYDINCVFLHLLENPTLCDRRALEIESDDWLVDEYTANSW
jgi:hypothetical protein